MPSDPITTTEGLKPGDIVMVAVQLLDKQTRQPFWWKSFRAIIACDRGNKRWASVLTLKMHVDVDKDIRTLDFQESDQQVITRLDSHEVPQGVAAMLMKHIAQGTIKLDLT